MDSSPLIDALVVGGSLAALIASILAIYMVILALRVYRLTLTAYTNFRDAIMQITIQAAERPEEPPTRPPAEERRTIESVERPPSEQLSSEARHEPYDSLQELTLKEGYAAALLFDESGQVIDSEGSIDARREAALLAEILSSLQLARSSIRGLQMIDEETEALMPVTEVLGRRVYLYVKAPKEFGRHDIEFLTESARRTLRRLLSGG